MGYENTSLRITVCHHSASLVMPIGDPRDGFFYPTLILMMDPYILAQLIRISEDLPWDRKSYFIHVILPSCHVRAIYFITSSEFNAYQM